MSRPISYLDESGKPAWDKDAAREHYAEMRPPVRIVKPCDTLADRKESLLKSLEHFEAQAGRLLKMARDIRAELLKDE